jgi:5-carboxymethyl-2-hydroxymuconate isomerase
MPHVTLEYTSNLPAAVAGTELLGRLHLVLAGVGGIDIGNCKGRAVRLDTFLVGDDAGDPGVAAYVHLDVRILEGRPGEVKAELGRRLLDTLRDAYDAAHRGTQITVEIRDMARDLYFKHG